MDAPFTVSASDGTQRTAFDKPLPVPGPIHLARLGQGRERGGHQPRRPLQRFGIVVGQAHLMAAQRENQGQRMPHQAGADNCYFRHVHPLRQPRLRRPAIDIRCHIDDDRFIRCQCVPQRRPDLRRVFDADAAQAEHPRHIGEIRRPEAHQFGDVTRLVALLALNVRPALPEARVVVDHQHDRDAAPSRRLQFRQVIIQRPVARPADHFSMRRGAFRAQRRRERPAERPRRT